MLPGLGLAITLQFVPFQCSVSVRGILLCWLADPTAHTSCAETAATAKSVSSPGGLGLGTALQVPPLAPLAPATPARQNSTISRAIEIRENRKAFDILLLLPPTIGGPPKALIE